MKQIFILILLTTSLENTFSQQNDSLKSLPKTDYLQKSKHQKTAAWVVLVGGVTLATTGAIIVANEPVLGPSGGNGGEVLFVAGIAVAAASIPFFIVSAKNRKKARSLSSSFRMETMPAIQRTSVARKSCPAISITVGF